MLPVGYEVLWGTEQNSIARSQRYVIWNQGGKIVSPIWISSPAAKGFLSRFSLCQHALKFKACWIQHNTFVFAFWTCNTTSSTGQKGSLKTNKQLSKWPSWRGVLVFRLEVQPLLLNDWSDYWKRWGELAALRRMHIQLPIEVSEWLIGLETEY